MSTSIEVGSTAPVGVRKGRPHVRRLPTRVLLRLRAFTYRTRVQRPWAVSSLITTARWAPHRARWSPASAGRDEGPVIRKPGALDEIPLGNRLECASRCGGVPGHSQRAEAPA